MKIPKGGIGVFDSGIGGLTVLSECQKRLPNELFYYYGDNAHAPYGNRTEKQIRRYVFRAMRKFKRLRAKAVVLACNTATAVCIEEIRLKFPFPVIGAEPAILQAAKEGGRVFVLTTRATHDSLRFIRLCEKVETQFPKSAIIAFACEKLAGAIEENLSNDAYDFTVHLPKGNPAAVVLGCTHYIYINRVVQNFYQCKTYDGNEGISRRLYQTINKTNTKVSFRKRITKNNQKKVLARPFLTTKANCGKRKNAFWAKFIPKTVIFQQGTIIVFIRKSAVFNANIYEQMFAFNKNG